MKDRMSRVVDRIYKAKAELDWAAKVHECSRSQHSGRADALDSVNMLDADSASMLRSSADLSFPRLIDESWNDLRAMESAILTQLEFIKVNYSRSRFPNSDSECGEPKEPKAAPSAFVQRVKTLLDFTPSLSSFLKAVDSFETILSVCVEVHRRLLQLSDAYEHASANTFDFYGFMRDQLQTCLSKVEQDERASGRYIGDLRTLGKKLDAELKLLRNGKQRPSQWSAITSNVSR